MQENKNEKENIEKSKNKIYVSYNVRLIILLTIFTISLIIFAVFLSKSFKYQDAKILHYKDNQAIDYKVYLKENDFYEEEYLGKDMVYVANLIDKININFNYVFEIDNTENVLFNYKVLADLVIESPNGGNKYFEKRYVLSEDKKEKMEQNNRYEINKAIDIDYDYYNRLANNFKSSYGLDTNSYLKVYLQVEKQAENEKLNINNDVKSVMNIPLSEKSVEINFNTEEASKTNSVMVDSNVVFDTKNIIIVIISFVITIITMIKIIKMLNIIKVKKSKYDKFVSKVLKEYDRLIIEAKANIDLKNNNVIIIERFEELLDVHDNLKLPIMYHNISNHQKCYFYVKKDNDVYLMKVKAVDMENEENEKE